MPDTQPDGPDVHHVETSQNSALGEAEEFAAHSRESLDGGNIPSNDDAMGNRLVFMLAGMVIVMFIIALGFLFIVARHRPL